MDLLRPSGLQRLLGPSEAAERVRRFARRAAANDAPALITGETGTGKGVLARAIHESSGRARRPFVAVNCAGVPTTLFESAFFGHGRGAFTGAVQAHRGFLEQASGGTLFLDEIGELPIGMQAKLLSALEDEEVRRIGSERAVRVDVRILAATNLELGRAVAAGEFRADLYHRLLVLGFRVPPLRERYGDIDFFAHLFLGRFSERHRGPARGFEPAATARIHAYPWPGNVRELAHAVEAAVLACERARIRVRDLPDHVRASGPAALAFPATSRGPPTGV
ncbi:MAG: sigma 54-interacting transcriptional regulator, partial [Longimicrobiales bacterium]